MNRLPKIALLLFSFLFFSQRVIAAEDFITSYDINYDLDEKGNAHVDYTIRLKNLTSDTYVSSYGLVLGFKNIFNVAMFDSSGPLKIDATSYEKTTEISADINDKIAGVGKVLGLRLEFSTTDLAQKNGQVWEVILPGLPLQIGIENYNVNLEVPASFGNLLYVSPKPKKNLYWTKNELKNENITVYFGQLQIFDFDLNYYLHNDQKTVVRETIALIPDTSLQKIYLYTLEPKPIDIYRDNDGNWLADYVLKADEKLKILATGSAEIYWDRREDFKVSNKNLEIYKKPQKYWEVNDQEIKTIAKNLKTPRAIYEYVINILSYDYDRAVGKPKRMGAKKALKNPDLAICMEYTDLFIALTRAAGIAAREVDGYAYTQNPKLFQIEKYADVLHTWPEYYDEAIGAFRPVDPTWEDSAKIDYFSKFDLNHLAFVIRGEDSTYPYPAGSYKEQRMKKTIKVDFGEKREAPGKVNQLDFKFIKAQYLSGFAQNFDIKIVNNGPEAIYDLEVEFRGDNFLVGKKNKLSKVHKIQINELLPFKEYDTYLYFRKSDFSFKGNNKLTISYLDHDRDIELKFLPFYVKYGLYFIFGGGLLVTAIIFIIAKKTRRLPFKKQ